MGSVGKREFVSIRAKANFRERRKIGAVLFISQINSSSGCVDSAVAPKASRSNAIKEIHAFCNASKEVSWLPNTQKMSRLPFRQFWNCSLKCSLHVLLTERASNTKPIEVHGADLLRTLSAKILMPPSLYDAEERLLRF